MKIVLFTEPYVEVTDAKPLAELKRVAEVRVALSSSEEQLIKDVRDCDALVVRLAKVTKRIIDNAETLKVIGRTGTGVDNIDVDAATKRGIFVCNVPALNSDSVAEYTFGLLLNLAKNTLEADRRMRSQGWSFRDDMWPRNVELRGKVVGIIGLGVIGSRVASIAREFGMRVLTYDPYVSVEKARSLGAELMDLDELLKESDFVTIHCSLTKETKDLIDQSKLALMKKTAFLINCSRGSIVNEDALVACLKKKMIAGAALDVFAVEPVDMNNPLLRLENTIVTPHLAGMTYEVRERSILALVEDIVRVFNGKLPKNLANPGAIEFSSSGFKKHYKDIETW
jgi:D-3-phosphoglycerate dehydrogenase